MENRAARPGPGMVPDCLPGFENIRRYRDPRTGDVAAKILPGDYYVTRADEWIHTVLGSCVSACIYDEEARIGGMNHFMLPRDSGAEDDGWKSSSVSAATRYGNFAMEHLVNDILKHGGRRERLRFKVFGGGKVMGNLSDIGSHNVTFVLDYMATEGYRVLSQDLGSQYPRKVLFHPRSGRVRVKKLRRLEDRHVVRQELDYMQKLEKRSPSGGDVELF